MSRNSKLVKALRIKTAGELEDLTQKSKYELRASARRVLIEGMTYAEAGKPTGISKHAVYEYLKRIYKKKYGEPYAP